MVLVPLSAADDGACRRLAHVRNDRKVALGIKPWNPANLDTLELNEGGLRGETAVAKLLGVSIDANEYLDGDEGWDLEKDGKHYQVKFNHWPNGDLYFKYGPMRGGWDYGVLTVPAAGGVRVVGWITRLDFFKKRQVWDYTRTNNPVWRVTPDQLEPIATLPGRIV